MVSLFHVLAGLVGAIACWSCLATIRHDLLKFLLFAGLGIVHGWVPAIADLAGIYPSTPIREEAAVFAFFGLILLWSGWEISEYFARSKARGISAAMAALTSAPVANRLAFVFWTTAILGFLAWLLSILALGASVQEFAESGRFDFRLSGNAFLGWLFTGLMQFGIIPGFLGFFISSRHRLLGILYAVTYAALFLLITKGTRSYALGLLGSVLSGYLLYRKQSIPRLVTTGGIGLGIVLLAVAMLPLRWRMSELTLPEILAFLASTEWCEGAIEQDPLNYHENLVGVMQVFPDRHDFLHAAAYRRIPFFFLPHSKFPTLKPEDPNRIVAQFLSPEVDPSLDPMYPPSFFGDIYINFYGWCGVGFALVQGLVLAWLARIANRHTIGFLILAPNMIQFVLVGLRGQPYEIFVYILVSFVWTGLILKLANIRFYCHPACRRVQETVVLGQRQAGARPFGAIPPR
ncbi:MAG: hypothetical protein MUE50_11925 [Pirellulaceae bacterium]|nr:hypothetical protein [Pirellulaceae bacterium]